MGDHGHDATGRHAVGLDVPTYALYRGPRFVPGVDLGTVAIRDQRYLLGFGLGLSLPGDYAGSGMRALRAGAAGLGSYAAAVGGRPVLSPGVPREAYFGYVVGGVVLAGLFAVWFVAVSGASGFRRRSRESGLGLGLGLGKDDAPLGEAGRGVAAPASRAHVLRCSPALQRVFVALGALGICGLGVLFPSVRPFVHEPTYVTLGVLWVGLWAGALVVTWRARRIELAALVLGLPLFLAVPTVYRYGAPPAMGLAWLGFLACVAVLLMVLKLGRPPLAAAALSCILLLPFAFAESSGFRFDEWILWPPAALPNGFLLLSLVAKWIVLVPPQPESSDASHGVRIGAGLLAAAFLTLVQLGMVPHVAQLVAALALFSLWALETQRQRIGKSRAIATTACVTALLLVHHYAVRIPTNAYYWQDCLLAALVLSARLIRPLPSPARTFAHSALLLLAFFVSGWVSFAWTLHRLEWAFLYDFWSAAFVESRVAAFLPLLMGRFALPLIAARVLLRRELGVADDERALGWAWLLVGSKVASLMFWSYGTAFVSVASDVYLEAVQETSLACVLLLGLL